jgi:micrococcal nuclease
VSKPWNPRIVPGGRGRERGWAGQRDRLHWPVKRQRRRGRTRADLRALGATVLTGLTAGLAVALWPGPHSAPAPGGHAPIAATAPAADPWAESRRSRAILERQEAPPLPTARREVAVAAPAERALPAAVRILDGDTFDYGGERIRIADIDTPELRGQCAFERALAARATQRMRALIAAGPFELRRAGSRDEDVYGRKLRIVTRGGRSLGDQMVAQGLARPWRGHREPWC